MRALKRDGPDGRWVGWLLLLLLMLLLELELHRRSLLELIVLAHAVRRWSKGDQLSVRLEREIKARIDSLMLTRQFS